ncbi:MAG: 50S ribosomal protein L18 [Planctomycetes bacterium]|jgi:large subunit ribosomal protein L18|nr:50S ribosomal protein L18 [Planctomycetota bacterium]
MESLKRKNTGRLRRKRSTRARIKKVSKVPRLSVCRSNQHIYAQIIDDAAGRTLAHVGTCGGALKDGLEGKKKSEKAAIVGAEIARLGIEAGVERVVFDRGDAKYHGRVKALAEAAREGGLKF